MIFSLVKHGQTSTLVNHITQEVIYGEVIDFVIYLQYFSYIPHPTNIIAQFTVENIESKSDSI